MIIPAIALVLGLGAGAVQLGAIEVRLTDAAADAARLVGRGDPAGAAAARIAGARPGATMEVEHEGPVVCVTAHARVGLGPLADAFELEATGCALDDVSSVATGGSR
jgi:hypothetical protein